MKNKIAWILGKWRSGKTDATLPISPCKRSYCIWNSKQLIFVGDAHATAEVLEIIFGLRLTSSNMYLNSRVVLILNHASSLSAPRQNVTDDKNLNSKYLSGRRAPVLYCVSYYFLCYGVEVTDCSIRRRLCEVSGKGWCEKACSFK